MTALPQYKKVFKELKEKVLSGEFSEGSLLPSENDLSRQYKTTRATIRQALGEMVKDGLIDKQMGKGSMVINSRKTLGLLSFKGFSEVVQSASLKPTTIILEEPKVVNWYQPFFYELSNEEQESGCIQLVRLRKVDNKPVMLEYTYFPNYGLEGICHKPLINNSLFNTLLKNYHIEVEQVNQDVRAIPATTRHGVILNVAKDTPLLHIYRKYETSQAGFHIYSSLYCDTTNYTIGNLFN